MYFRLRAGSFQMVQRLYLPLHMKYRLGDTTLEVDIIMPCQCSCDGVLTAVDYNARCQRAKSE